MKMANKKIKNAGFTVLELLISGTLATILLSVGVPSFSAIINNNRLVTETNTFVTALNIARSEAVKQGQRVTICKSVNGNRCSLFSRWEQGWLVFVDVDGNSWRDYSADSEETIIQVGEALSDGNDLTVVSGGILHLSLSYLPNGRMRGSDGRDSWTFKICDPQVSVVRKIKINMTGRPQLEKVTESCA